MLDTYAVGNILV